MVFNLCQSVHIYERHFSDVIERFSVDLCGLYVRFAFSPIQMLIICLKKRENGILLYGIWVFFSSLVSFICFGCATEGIISWNNFSVWIYSFIRLGIFRLASREPRAHSVIARDYFIWCCFEVTWWPFSHSIGQWIMRMDW